MSNDQKPKPNITATEGLYRMKQLIRLLRWYRMNAAPGLRAFYVVDEDEDKAIDRVINAVQDTIDMDGATERMIEKLP